MFRPVPSAGRIRFMRSVVDAYGGGGGGSEMPTLPPFTAIKMGCGVGVGTYACVVV